MPNLIRLRKFSFRFAEQVLNSKLSIKQEIEDILANPETDFRVLTRPFFNDLLKKRFVSNGWESQPPVFNEPNDPSAKMDFLKERIGIEVEFGHSSFIGIDLLKFQVASYSGLDKIDVGVYITTTHNFQKRMRLDYGKNWKVLSVLKKLSDIFHTLREQYNCRFMLLE